jgi:hypothetical protein
MVGDGRPTAEQIQAATPEERNRFADLLRLGSIVVVVVGHWLIAVVLVVDGEWVTGRLLEFVDWTRWLTWVFQVMPIFFFVGGYANAVSWSAAAERGTPWAVWVRRRSRRLLRPVIPLVALWVPLAVALSLLGVPGELLRLGSQVAFIPAWFLAAYLLVVAAAPLTFTLHRRFGLGALAGLVAIAVVVDVLHLAVGVPVVGYSNFLWVWAAVHQLGYWWFDQRLSDSLAVNLGLAVGGYAVLVALTTVGGYPVAMLGVEPTGRSNNSPTSIALFVLGVAQFGLIAAVRHHAARWLQRARAWSRVVVGGSVAMTVYLWHQTALVVVIALTIPTGLWPMSETVDALWWALRPLWLVLCGAVLFVLVRVFAKYERVGEPRSRPGRIRAAIGVVATVAGIGLLLLGGLHDPDRTAGIPLTALGLLFGGLGALGVIRNHPAADLAHPQPGETRREARPP